MADRKIDYDRGVFIRTAPALGMDVFMYRDTPGVYLNAHGHEVGEEIAKMAGFDVVRFAIQRRRKEALSAAARAVDAELLATETMDKMTVVKEKGGYQIVALTSGRHQVKDPDGNVLTQGVVLTLEMAEKVLDSIILSETQQAQARAKPETPAGAGVRGGLRAGGATPLRTN